MEDGKGSVVDLSRRLENCPLGQAILFSMITFLGIPFLLRYVWNDHGNPSVIHFIVICRLDSIAMGVVLAFLKRFHEKIWRAISSPKILAVGVFLMISNGAYLGMMNLPDAASRTTWEKRCPLI
jgi:peptidoglycan/LPS O-acetylase OafA/YrhL